MRPDQRPFTAEEDAEIIRLAPDHTIAEVGTALGRDRSSVWYRIRHLVGEGRIPAVCRRTRDWTDEEDEQLLYLVRTRDRDEVARALGRTTHACECRLKVLIGKQPASRLRPEGSLRMRELAREMGVHRDMVAWWVRVGLLRPVRFGMVKGRTGPACFPPEEIRRFLTEYPTLYRATDMLPGPYRRLAERVQREALSDPVMTIRQVAEWAGVDRGSVEKAIRRGRLVARHRPGCRAEREIRRSDAVAWRTWIAERKAA